MHVFVWIMTKDTYYMGYIYENFLQRKQTIYSFYNGLDRKKIMFHIVILKGRFFV